MSEGRLALQQLMELFGPMETQGPEPRDRAHLLALLERRLTPQQEEQRLIRDAVDAGMDPAEAVPLDAEQLRRHRPLKRVDTLTGEEGEVV